jgi:hypothetical protein
MFQIILSSLLLSVVHASIPNHWLPLVAIAKAEHWDRRTALRATAITGFAHIASTILIGIAIGWAGYELSSGYKWIYSIAAPAILILLGLIYVTLNFFHSSHQHAAKIPSPNLSFTAVVLPLSVGMFFSPCIELESYYFTAGKLGWPGITVVSCIYLVATVSFMLTFVAIGLAGVNKLRLDFVERNEKAIIGSVLIIVGIMTYFIEL